MLVKRTRGNQVSLPKQVLKEAGITDGDRYFDVVYRGGLICLKPVTVEDKIPDRAYEELLQWAGKTEPGDRTFRTGREAVGYLRRIAKKPRR